MSTRLQIFRSLWTNGFNLEAALVDCSGGLYDGVEGPVPDEAAARHAFGARLREAGVPFIAEIVVGGGYVPTDSSPARHLEEFRRKAESALETSPLFLTVLAGCDSWPLATSVKFYDRLLAVAAGFGVVASIETHRSRPTFNPWATTALLAELPALRLTCDFSHWCCVCERLVVDTEPGLLELCASRAHHVHARIGYEQGPQVPHPAATKYATTLAAHEHWWSMIWLSHECQVRERTTMTPEFGPDGYLQESPFTAKPVADLDEINGWIATRQRRRFDARAAEALHSVP